jgi:uncharacterized membrane protein (UPF0127 family)
MKLSTLPLLLSLLLSALGCDHSPAGLPMVTMRLGNKSFQLEVAATEPAQETGLMKRDSMPEDHGMIFVFKDEKVLAFWMKNTRFPLDIIYIDSQGKVVSIRRMQPYDLNTTSSIYPAKYAIELNAGAAENAGVKVGDALNIPPAARGGG